MRHPLATNLTNHMAKLGADLPEPIAQVVDHAEKIHTAAQDITDPGDLLVEAFASAVDAGKDPATDKAVIAAITRQQLAGPLSIVSRVENAQTVAISTVIRQHSDDIVAELQRHLDIAVDDLTAAHEALGNIDPDNTQQVLRLGAAGAEAWSAYQRGIATVQHIEAAWKALLFGAHNVTSNRHNSALIWTQYNPEHTADTTVYDLVRQGSAITLATARGYAERVAEVGAARQAEADEQAGEFGRQYRRQQGIVVG